MAGQKKTASSPAGASRASGIHDRFFKRACELPGAAADLCREALPPEIFALFDWPRCRLAKDSFHDGKRADLVVAVPFLSDPGVLTYIVIEHKSQHEPKKTYAQFYRYQMQFSNDQFEKHGMLPEILLVLIHQGKRPYKGPLSLREALGHPISPKSRMARQNMPGFKPYLLDLHDPRLEEVFKDSKSKIGVCLYLLRHVWDRRADVEFVLGVLGMFGGDFLRKYPDFALSMLDYLFEGYKMRAEAWAEAEREAVRRGLLPKGGYMTIREEIEERGIRKGHREGRVEGRQEERRKVIANMFKEKFDISVISRATGLPEAEIIKFKNGEIKSPAAAETLNQAGSSAQNGQAE